MKKITYKELKAIFQTHESTRPKDHLTACIVFTADSFTEPYSLESRTYEVSSDNKAFQSCMGGYSIFASSLDRTDLNVRLEGLMAAEHGGKNGWKVDYCYLKE